MSSRHCIRINWCGTLLESNTWHSFINLERWRRAEELTKVQDYTVSLKTSALDPAVVAQMCSPITHVCPPSSSQVIDGKLAPYLSKVIKFASSHVFSCSLCREKGFICELCHNGQVIYPFQESAITRYSFSQLSPFYSVPCYIYLTLILWGRCRSEQEEYVKLENSWIRSADFCCSTLSVVW